ncbi:glycosyltransferase [Gammaproteobacteria bacterium]|nr:glycosyltransferase [Gammaproteobacteria bacterium]
MLANILTKGPDSYNARAFLHPIIRNKVLLHEYGINYQFFYEILPATTNCDVLIIDSKFFKSWYQGNEEKMYTFLDQARQDVKIIFFDTTDSAGYILGDILPYVDRYLKHQILADKKLYLTSLYGRRFFSDYYHKKYGVFDDIQHEEKDPQVLDSIDLKKIDVGWNTGLANYSLLGEYLGKLYKKTNLSIFSRSPRKFVPPDSIRKYDVQCRMNTEYDKLSVSFQRKLIADNELLSLQKNKVNRYKYFQELANTKIILSPFGLGEITLKDFEAFISGALLIKPKMEHMITWPNLYAPNKTILDFNLDLNDLNDVIEAALENKKNRIEIAREGQNRYKHYLKSLNGSIEFVERFKKLVTFQ